MKFITATLLMALAPLAQAHGPEAHAKPAVAAVEAQAARAAPVVKVVEEFSTALQAGDLGRAGALLAENVLIRESGGAERSKKENLGGHARHVRPAGSSLAYPRRLSLVSNVHRVGKVRRGGKGW